MAFEKNFRYLPNDIDQIIENLGTVNREFSGKNILLTGGEGFLGRYFVAYFNRINEKVLEKPCRVISIDNGITAGNIESQEQYGPSIELKQQDIIQCTDPKVFDVPFDFVIHGAGIASPYYYRAHPLATLDVAVIGTRNTLEIARYHKARYLFFSSSEIYGDPDPQHVPIPETYRGNVSCLGPRACYDESKRLGETLTRIYFEQFGLPTVIVRPFNVYGPGMQQKDYRVLPNFAGQIVKDKPLKVYGNGKQTRTFCYISDALNGFLRALTLGQSGEPYNIGNPSPEISMLDLTHLMGQLLKRPLFYDCVHYPDEYPGDEPQRRCPDITKAKNHLAYEPRTTLESGLEKFLNWAQVHYQTK